MTQNSGLIRSVTDATEVAKAWDMLIRSGENASMYMLMFFDMNKGYAFKHIDTREYRYLKDVRVNMSKSLETGILTWTPAEF